MIEIEYILSPHQREAIEPIMERATPMIPPWVTAISVRYVSDLDAMAKVNSVPEYRMLHIQIGDAWFSETPEGKPLCIIHELSHGYVASMAQAYRTLLLAFTNDGSPVRQLGEEAIRIAEEACVSDLSRVFKGLLR